MRRRAPIARLAFAFGAGVAAGLVGAPWWTAPLLLAIAAAAPIRASPRLVPPVPWAAVLAAGLLAGAGGAGPVACHHLGAGPAEGVRGRLLVTPRLGSAPFETDDGCTVTLVLADPADTVTARAGLSVEVDGAWRVGRRAPWLQARAVRPVTRADRAESSRVASFASGERWPEVPWPSVRWLAVRWRDMLVARLHRLYPEHGPLVSALVLARREGLDPEVRAAFARTGIAHLLAISGFHVGLIAGLVFAGLRRAGRSRRAAAIGAAAGAWLYVGLIGFPDAAFRAALILTFVAASRVRGYPPSRWGPLSAAGLVLLALGPARLAQPGFQLSFAGAAGLVAWARPLERWLARGSGRVVEALRPGARIPSSALSALAAGIAATAATLPVVGWHFERVSLVGIPVTLVATPLVSLALPAALVTLALDFVASGAAEFLAGGVGWVLDALVRLTLVVGAWPWASAWTSRPAVIAGCTGVVVATVVARAPRIGRRTRLRLALLYALALLVGWPMLVSFATRGRLEILMLDVGQGDAIAIRTPRDRWVLVDAGPPGRGEAGEHPVVRELRGRGVRRLETLVLTHPDLDHIGGAPAVVEYLRPRTIVDPMLPAPKSGYADLVELALARGIPWSAGRRGSEVSLDGVELTVLHPDTLPADPEDGNAASVVLLLSWNGFEALLTGDAYVDVERALAAEVGDLDVLKVGHHGSRTSTDSAFLATVRPEIALLSVGRSNRYGHPAPEVVARLEGAGAAIYRTDRQGSVTLVVERDGSVRVRTAR